MCVGNYASCSPSQTKPWLVTWLESRTLATVTNVSSGVMWITDASLITWDLIRIMDTHVSSATRILSDTLMIWSLCLVTYTEGLRYWTEDLSRYLFINRVRKETWPLAAAFKKDRGNIYRNEIILLRAGLFESRLTLTYDSISGFNLSCMKCFHCLCFVGFRFVNAKTKERKLCSAQLTKMLENKDGNLRSYWISLNSLWTTQPYGIFQGL